MGASRLFGWSAAWTLLPTSRPLRQHQLYLEQPGGEQPGGGVLPGRSDVLGTDGHGAGVSRVSMIGESWISGLSSLAFVTRPRSPAWTAPGITVVGALSTDGARLLQLSARESFEHDLAVATLTFARRHEEAIFARNAFLGAVA